MWRDGKSKPKTQLQILKQFYDILLEALHSTIFTHTNSKIHTG